VKVGDLVALSAAGQNLRGLSPWHNVYRAQQGKKPLVGTIIKVEYWSYREVYKIRWFDDAPPKGRNGRWGGIFERKDLKFISKA